MKKNKPSEQELAAIRAGIQARYDDEKSGGKLIYVVLWGACLFVSRLIYSELDHLQAVGLYWLGITAIVALFILTLSSCFFLYCNSLRREEQLDILDAVEGYKGHELHEK
jgi:hypothetical protein